MTWFALAAAFLAYAFWARAHRVEAAIVGAPADFALLCAIYFFLLGIFAS